jgi:hypothetical protein
LRINETTDRGIRGLTTWHISAVFQDDELTDAKKCIRWDTTTWYVSTVFQDDELAKAKKSACDGIENILRVSRRTGTRPETRG